MATKKKTTAKKSAKKTTAKKTTAKKTTAKKPAAAKKPAKAPAPSGDTAQYIEARFREIGGWRGQTLARMRKLILDADPELVEERKWIKPSNPHGVPTYSRAGLVATLEVYKAAVKVTFAYGSKFPDPTRIFNNSLLGLRRAVDIHEGESVDGAAFQALVRAAVDVNLKKKAR